MELSRATWYVICVWLTSLCLPPLFILTYLQMNGQAVNVSLHISIVYMLLLVASALYGLPGLVLFAVAARRALQKYREPARRRMSLLKAATACVLLTFLLITMMGEMFAGFGWWAGLIVMMYLVTTLLAVWFYPMEASASA